MRWLALVLVALGMTGAAFGQVTLDFVRNPDPGEGFQSFTVRATGIGINTLSGFNVIGDVYQVWTQAGVQSEWINHGSGSTPDNPMDSHVLFGNARLADLPNFPGGPYGQTVTFETLNEGGTEGLGTLSNVGSVTESTGSSEGDPGGTIVPGDANLDGKVDNTDAIIMANHWGCKSATWAMGDFNGDGVVMGRDAGLLFANWGYGTAESGGSEMGGQHINLFEGASFGAADAYVAMGTPTQYEETVDLLQLVVPTDQIVAVELEVLTTEYDAETGFFTVVTGHEFIGENAIVVGVPEPTTLVLLGMGAVGLLVSRWRRRR